MSYQNDFKLDGEVCYIDDSRPAKEGSTFLLRDMGLRMVMMGEANEIKVQLKGNNCERADPFMPGDKVTISFSLLGSLKPKDEKKSAVLQGRNKMNPNGYDGFSPNVNVYDIAFQTGWVRPADKMFEWQRIQNGDANNPTSPNTPLQTPNTQPPTVDDLPF